jgi:hypothetical protein
MQNCVEFVDEDSVEDNADGDWGEMRMLTLMLRIRTLMKQRKTLSLFPNVVHAY